VCDVQPAGGSVLFHGNRSFAVVLVALLGAALLKGTLLSIFTVPLELGNCMYMLRIACHIGP
jgi:hypothetical protein